MYYMTTNDGNTKSIRVMTVFYGVKAHRNEKGDPAYRTDGVTHGWSFAGGQTEAAPEELGERSPFLFPCYLGCIRHGGCLMSCRVLFPVLGWVFSPTLSVRLPHLRVESSLCHGGWYSAGVFRGSFVWELSWTGRGLIQHQSLTGSA